MCHLLAEVKKSLYLSAFYEAVSVCSKACGWTCVCAVLSGRGLTAIEGHKVWCFGALMQSKGHGVRSMYFYILNRMHFQFQRPNPANSDTFILKAGQNDFNITVQYIHPVTWVNSEKAPPRDLEPMQAFRKTKQDHPSWFLNPQWQYTDLSAQYHGRPWISDCSMYIDKNQPYFSCIAQVESNDNEKSFRIFSCREHTS